MITVMVTFYVGRRNAIIYLAAVVVMLVAYHVFNVLTGALVVPVAAASHEVPQRQALADVGLACQYTFRVKAGGL